MKFDGQQNATSPKHTPPDSSVAENPSPHLKSGTNNNFSTTQDPDELNTTSTKSLRPDLESNYNSTARTRNFSFSSSYHPNISTFNNRIDSSANLDIYPYKPIGAFTVLNSEEGLSPLGSSKPNAIVRPIRRFDNQELAWSARQDVTNGENTLWSQRKHHLKDNLNSTSSKKMTHFSLARPTTETTEQLRGKLNRTLHNLHETAETWISSRHSSNASQQENVVKRPLFITTVPTGVFLPPPKEPPLPWFLRPHIYAYSSHPVVLATGNAAASDGDNDSPVASANIPAGGKVLSSNQLKSVIPNPKANAISSIAPNPTTNVNVLTTNGSRRGQPSPPSKYSLTGGVNLTQQQFHEQIQQRRAKRDVPPPPYRNVMYDRRVIRGSVFGTQQLLENSDPFDKAAEIRRRHAIRKQKVCRSQRNVLGTPPPVNGRRHEVIQTEKYLEELVQRPPEFSVDTQTDLFLEKPPEPPYIPAKVGVDAATEIADGELFHFDAEAQPIIDILVDACIEQSMLEVAHEQEIAALRQKQAEFMAQREAELAELRRLEAEELRLQAEKERRLQQDTIAKELDEEMQKSVTAAKLLQGHIAGLLPEVLDNLEPATDAAKKEHLMKTIAPWLTVEVAEEVGHIVDSREILTVIIQEIIKQRATAYAGYKEDIPLETVIERGEDDMIEEITKEEICTCESSDISSEKTDKCDDMSKKV
ncbi:radial spoke head protein 3 homolog [Zeugodacus cucurbitae]|uniref:radial spoke head protein 3 homolog n=1 Tax=Zeugodacus cucurbitae TaxID=28588 RepID=UPI0023D94E5A|nr:radial spoke head protein 3 homolog [Zeugodacus cucurbitae]